MLISCLQNLRFKLIECTVPLGLSLLEQFVGAGFFGVAIGINMLTFLPLLLLVDAQITGFDFCLQAVRGRKGVGVGGSSLHVPEECRSVSFRYRLIKCLVWRRLS